MLSPVGVGEEGPAGTEAGPERGSLGHGVDTDAHHAGVGDLAEPAAIPADPRVFAASRAHRHLLYLGLIHYNS